MNYLDIYDKLINKALSENRKKRKREHQDFIYYEKHHIIPRCRGGEDKQENYVLLTAKEHFVAHKLLVEIFPKEYNLVHALWAMCNYKNKEHVIGAREYNSIKELNSKLYSKENNPRYGKCHSEKTKKLISLKAKNRLHSDETKEKLRQINLGKTLSKETREKISKASGGVNNAMYGMVGELSPNYGKPRSKETKEKLRQANSGRKLSEETKKKISEANKGYKHTEKAKKKIGEASLGRVLSKEAREKIRKASLGNTKLSSIEKVKCPHCDKILDIGNAKQWHFDKCKFKKQAA